MVTRLRWIVSIAGFVCAASVLAHAAGTNKAGAGTEGRRRAAENGLRSIKTKSSEQGEQVKALYEAAASANNAWLDAVSQAIQQGAATAPDVTAAVQTAATSLMEWVAVRNRTLGVPEITGVPTDAAKKSIVQDLTEISSAAWSTHHAADEKKRTTAASALKERFRWKSWEEVR